MSIPSQKDIRIPLLHLIHAKGGEVRRQEACEMLANYFGLTEEELEELYSSGNKVFEHRVSWVRFKLCSEGFLNGSTYGLWKITEKGINELSRLGFIDKPFPVIETPKNKTTFDITIRLPGSPLSEELEELLELIVDEIAPDGPKKFPEDFLDDNCTDFYEVELPGTQLQLAPLTRAIITSPKRHFRYQAKNPPEAKYILYAYDVGSKKIKIPKDNLTLFKVVKAYEKYCDELARKAFELFLEFTNDEDKAELLKKEVEKKLGLRAKREET